MAGHVTAKKCNVYECSAVSNICTNSEMTSHCADEDDVTARTASIDTAEQAVALCIGHDSEMQRQCLPCNLLQMQGSKCHMMWRVAVYI